MCCIYLHLFDHPSAWTLGLSPIVCAIMPLSHGKVNENPPVVADVLIASEGYALHEPWSHTHPGLPFSLMSTYPNSRDCQLCMPPQPAFGLNRLT
jgi:hypothetical protein